MALKLGATNTVKGGPGVDVAAEIKRITGGGADYAVECTGAPVCGSGVKDDPSSPIDSIAGMTQGNECLSKGGKLYLVGLPKHGTKLNVDCTWHIHGMIGAQSTTLTITCSL